MAKKNNLKSIRLSDQVMDYVINFEGDGFNQKFENLVLFCMDIIIAYIVIKKRYWFW